MLGLPETDASLFRRWIKQSLRDGITDPSLVMRVLDEMTAYFSAVIAKRRAAPGRDLVSFLLNAQIEGRKLTDEHINGTLRLLLMAGIDTTWSMIGICLWHNRYATFGLGMHRCLGSNLARMEINVALQEWLKVFPEFAMAPGADLAWSAGMIRGPRQLPLTIG
jgi:cytochrome P450